MRGVLWGWLIALGIVFWAAMVGLDFFLSLSTRNSLPEPVAPVVQTKHGPVSKQLLLYVMTVVVSVGLGVFIKRKFFGKGPGEPKIATVVEEQKQDAEQKKTETDCGKSAKVKQATKKAVPDVLAGTCHVTLGELLGDGDGREYLERTRRITPPTINVHELQAKLTEFEETLATLKRKGQLLIKHTSAQEQQWSALDHPSAN